MKKALLFLVFALIVITHGCCSPHTAPVAAPPSPTTVIDKSEPEFFIMGEVARPGRYPLVDGTTLLQAIAKAGGFTQFADPRRVKVYREDDVVVFNLGRIGKPYARHVVKHHDIIQVPKKK